MANAVYNVRLAILRRLTVGRAPTNEAREEWVEHARYSGKRLALNAGEEIRTGVKEGTTFLKLEIPGQKIPVAFDDRLRLVASGQEYRINAEPLRLERTTVISCESI